MRAQPVEGAAKDRPADPIAGRIAAAETDLDRLIDGWVAWMMARRCKQRSVEAYRQVVACVRRDAGWASALDVTQESITTWMSGKQWKGSTFNRNLSVFKSLVRYGYKNGFLVEDFLADADRAIDDGEEGSRAATTYEVRGLLLRAWARQQSDRRCKGDRALYRAVQALAAMRDGEPARLQWRHLVLDEPIPYWLATPDNSKGHAKAREIAIHPELVTLLRGWRERMGADHPLDRVFPVVPSKGSFAADREAAGIEYHDRRHRPFTSHSLRKWFSTTATQSGVPEKMVDFLMRHAGRPEHRYFDPPLDQQAAAIALLPPVWPGWSPHRTPTDVDNPCKVDNSHGDLTPGGTPAHHGDSRPSPSAAEKVPGNRAGPRRARQDQTRISGPRMPIVGAINGGSIEAEDLADLLETLARLLRRGAAHGSDDAEERAG